jgi:hypothetical protein
VSGIQTTLHDLVRQGWAKNKDRGRTFIGLATAFLVSAWMPAFGENEKVEAYELPTLYHTYEEEKATRFFTTLFDSELPITAKPGRWSFRYNVKVDDLVDKSYLRMPLEARYGLTPTTEVSMSSTTFLPNPFDSPSQSSLGFLGLGFKQRLNSFIDDQWALAFGAKGKVSIEDIPTNDPRDQFLRVEPFLVTVYSPPKLPRWQFINQIKYDWVTENPFHEFDVGPEPFSTFSFSPAFIYTPNGEWRYSLEVEYQTDQFDGGINDAYLVSPGIGWFPRKNKFLKKIPGDFDFGLLLTHGISRLPIDEGKDDVEAKLRVRWIYYGKKNLVSTWKALTANWREEE